MEFKKQVVEFKDNGVDVKFEFTPTEGDFWIAVDNLDVNYDEESQDICVYHSMEGMMTGDVMECIHKQKITN